MSIRRFALPLAAACWLAGCAGTPPAPDASTVIRQAEDALGSTEMRSLSVALRGTGGTFGQAYEPTQAWPGLNYSIVNRAMNFETGAFREEFARARSEPRGGGAVPPLGQGEQRQVSFTRDGLAWNTAGTAVVPVLLGVGAREHDLWLGTPHGALKAARKFNARAGRREEGGQSRTTLSFEVPGAFTATLVLDEKHLVSRIESTLPHPVLGDTPVVTQFSDYRDLGGRLRFPMRLQQSMGAHPVFDLQAGQVHANATVDIPVPDGVRGAKENVVSTAVAPGVWFLAGGSHNSVAVELADQIVLIESPLYDGRALAAMAAANALVPGKKVATVINSHHHFDHAGGLRAAAGEGATLVTSALAKPYFEQVFTNPNRVAPDHLARSGRSAKIVGVSGKHVISDGQRSIEVHELQGNVHAQGFMVVWLPKERLLVQADAYTPGPPNAAPPPVPIPQQVNLVQNIERLGWSVDRILPLHGRVVPMRELLVAVGR